MSGREANKTDSGLDGYRNSLRIRRGGLDENFSIHVLLAEPDLRKRGHPCVDKLRSENVTQLMMSRAGWPAETPDNLTGDRPVAGYCYGSMPIGVES